MKKITLLFALMITSLGFAQQQQYLFDFESGTPSGVVGSWYAFDNSPLREIVTNPDADGVNTSATTKVMKMVFGPGNAFYAGINNRWQDKVFGSWKIDKDVPSNLTVTMDVNKNYVGTVGIQMITSTGGSAFQITNQNVGNTVVNEWQTLTWTLPAIPPGLETNLVAFVVFVDWTQGAPDRAANSIIHIDNIRFNALKLTDPPVPTCTDGIQNGTETGVDCGGTCLPCITEPTTSAPVPTMPESEVLSVYSDSYTTNKVANFVFQDFTGGGPNTEVDIESNGNKAAKLTNLSYYGPAFTAIDLSVEDSPGVPKYNYVHLDYYATTSSEIKFYVIDSNLGACCGDAREPRYTIKATGGDEVLVKGVWKSVFIPLSFFKTYSGLGGLTWNGNPVSQLKFEGNGNLYYDNVYFSKSNTLGTEKFETSSVKMYPNPVKNTLTIDANGTIERVSVYNVLGQEVMKASPKSNRAELQTNELQKGVYMVKTEIDGKISISKVVKE
jgi:Secretion system C-terminal sorting domain